VVRVRGSDDIRRPVSMAGTIAAVRGAFAAADRAGLTGLVTRDAAVAALAARLAGEHGAGRDVPLGGW
jgi:hypothetical protein